MPLAQTLVLLGMGLLALGGVLHYPALLYRKSEVQSAGNYGAYWDEERYAERGRRFVRMARLIQGTGLGLLLLSLFV